MNMKNILNWFAAERWRASLSHAIIAVGFMVPFLLVSIWIPTAQWIGVAFVIGWFWSREKTQHEYRAKGGRQTAFVFTIGWLPWEWDLYSRFEFIVPAFTSAGLSLTLYFVK
jgi:hypothetical protein